MKPRLPSGLALPLLLALLANGCATKGLWDEQAFREPSQPPNLRLAFDPARKDVLVVYDEINDRSDKPRPRAYFLFQNVKRIEKTRKPAFVDPATAPKLSPVTIAGAEPLSAAEAGLDLCAVAATNSPGFKLFSKGRELGEFHLPVYKDGVWQTEKALLMPLAVGADTTIVGGFLWATWGFPGLPNEGYH